MTYEDFMSVVSDRHAGSPFSGMMRRGWRRISRGGSPMRWEKVGAGSRVVAVEGDEQWVRDTTAEWKAQHA